MKHTQRKIRVAIIVAILFSLLVTTAAFAAEGDPTVSPERLSGTQIGIKIEFPTDISGGFYGEMWGKHFDCVVVSSNVVYCIGPFAKWMKYGMFHLFVQGTNEEVLVKFIYIPPEQREAELQFTRCPQRECGDL